ncbi:hypothetical protein BDR03DRAFT_970326 [Suillus americanus]|nr:hypothetical protein BDR03DRAFT_970326 [Suillus americanus]
MKRLGRSNRQIKGKGIQNMEGYLEAVIIIYRSIIIAALSSEANMSSRAWVFSL